MSSSRISKYPRKSTIRNLEVPRVLPSEAPVACVVDDCVNEARPVMEADMGAAIGCGGDVASEGADVVFVRHGRDGRLTSCARMRSRLGRGDHGMGTVGRRAPSSTPAHAPVSAGKRPLSRRIAPPQAVAVWLLSGSFTKLREALRMARHGVSSTRGILAACSEPPQPPPSRSWTDLARRGRAIGSTFLTLRTTSAAPPMVTPIPANLLRLD